LWLFQLAQDAAQAMSDPAKEKLSALLQRTGGQDVMALRLPHPMERVNNVLVLK
jgi:hypothetical protein